MGTEMRAIKCFEGANLNVLCVLYLTSHFRTEKKISETPLTLCSTIIMYW